MTISDEHSPNSSSSHQSKPFSRTKPWYHPTLSPEHGVYIVLFVSFLTGAAAAQRWTGLTTLGLVCAFAGFQAEHPLVLQIKQRRSWKPRFLVWGGIYAGIAVGIAAYLFVQVPMLLWVYLGAIAAFLIDALAVFYRQQKSIANELVTFAGVCLAAPLAYIATSGTVTASVLGLWLLNALFFSSAVFTVKLRKPKSVSPVPGLLYNALSSLALLTLWYCGWLGPYTALAFALIVLKFGFILWQQEWYKTTRIQNVAMLETIFALAFLAVTSISLLPAHLPAPTL